MTMRRERRRRTWRRETRVCLQPIRVDVEADRRSQHRIYNQYDCLTPHNQRPYPYYAGNIVASSFALPLPARAFLLFLVPQAGTPLRSFHVDITWDLLLSSLLSPLIPLALSLRVPTRSVATARGASLPRSWLEMRLGGARRKRTRLYYKRQK